MSYGLPGLLSVALNGLVANPRLDVATHCTPEPVVCITIPAVPRDAVLS